MKTKPLIIRHRGDVRATIFNTLAPFYDTHMSVTGHVTAEEELLCGVLPPPAQVSRVLDLACGTGVSTAILARKYPRAQIRGVDISERALDLARTRFKGNRLVQFEHRNADRFMKGWFTETFDLIAMVYAVCWIRTEQIAPNLSSVMSLNGCVVIIDDVNLPKPMFSSRFPEVAPLIARTRRVIELNQVQEIFRAAGFISVRRAFTEVANTHESYGICFQKGKTP